MWQFFWQNRGTFLVGLVVLVVVAAIIAKLIRDKRKGRCLSCDCCGTTCSKEKSKET